jgi:hypothetical protein
MLIWLHFIDLRSLCTCVSNLKVNLCVLLFRSRAKWWVFVLDIQNIIIIQIQSHSQSYAVCSVAIHVIMFVSELINIIAYVLALQPVLKEVINFDVEYYPWNHRQNNLMCCKNKRIVNLIWYFLYLKQQLIYLYISVKSTV